GDDPVAADNALCFNSLELPSQAARHDEFNRHSAHLAVHVIGPVASDARIVLDVAAKGTAGPDLLNAQMVRNCGAAAVECAPPKRSTRDLVAAQEERLDAGFQGLRFVPSFVAALH